MAAPDLQLWKSLAELAHAFGVDIPGMTRALQEAGLAASSGSPQPVAKTQEIARWMVHRHHGAQFCWHAPRVKAFFEEHSVEARSLHVPPAPASWRNSSWVSLGSVGAALGWSAKQTGQQLKDAGFRDRFCHPTAAAVEAGLVRVALLTSCNGRLAYFWHQEHTCLALQARQLTRIEPFLQQAFALAQALRECLTKSGKHLYSDALRAVVGKHFVWPQNQHLMPLPLVQRTLIVRSLLQLFHSASDKDGRDVLRGFMGTPQGLWGVTEQAMHCVEVARRLEEHWSAGSEQTHPQERVRL